MYIRNSGRTTLLAILTITTAFEMTVMSTNPGVTIAAASEQQTTESGESQEDAASNVSIVSGAPSLADKAYSPNPINVNVGDDVTWTNNDIQVHTVTSGNGPTDPGLKQDFDSGFTTLQPGKTFSHTFDSAGEFSYFCQIHLTMIGQVVVTSQTDELSTSDNTENEEEESDGYGYQ